MKASVGDGTARSRRARIGRAVPAALLALGLSATGVLLLGGQSDPMAAVAAPIAPEPAGAPALVPYRDAAAGFEFAHPAAWQPQAIAGGVLLRVGGQDAVSVKRTELSEPVDASNLADLRAVTDAVLGAPEAGLSMLRAEAATLGGLPGVNYLYTFQSAGLRGAHTHWFAFRGTTMYTLVFQALPDTGFAALATDFDRVANSFRVLDS
ncbi:MAG: hypothetical protein ACT4QF_11190 [Sporichthyaceae bacterium]